jgi:hypothetical protein
MGLYLDEACILSGEAWQKEETRAHNQAPTTSAAFTLRCLLAPTLAPRLQRMMIFLVRWIIRAEDCANRTAPAAVRS